MKVLLLSRVMRCIERNLAIFITFLLHVLSLTLAIRRSFNIFLFYHKLVKAVIYLYMKANVKNEHEKNGRIISILLM